MAKKEAGNLRAIAPKNSRPAAIKLRQPTPTENARHGHEPRIEVGNKGGHGPPYVSPMDHKGNALFQITRNIWQGRFASRQRLDELRRFGITHVINVGESPNQLNELDGPFQRVIWHPIEDLVRIPSEDAIQCVDAIHECIRETGSNVYIHCVAGWNRSPTVLWLYLVACGLDRDTATKMIVLSSYDAVPAHPALIDESLVDAILRHGAANFIPHPRPMALTAATVVEQRDERER